MKNDNTPVDIDFAEAAVPHYARRGIVIHVHDHAGLHLLLGQHVGRQGTGRRTGFRRLYHLHDHRRLILSLYTGLLGYVGAETGMSLDLLARKAFGAKGSYLRAR